MGEDLQFTLFSVSARSSARRRHAMRDTLFVGGTDAQFHHVGTHAGSPQYGRASADAADATVAESSAHNTAVVTNAPVACGTYDYEEDGIQLCHPIIPRSITFAERCSPKKCRLLQYFIQLFAQPHLKMRSKFMSCSRHACLHHNL